MVHTLNRIIAEVVHGVNRPAESLQFKRKSRTYSPKAKSMNLMDGGSATGGGTHPV
jgi:hypothetical protein